MSFDLTLLIPWLTSLSPVIPLVFTILGILVTAGQAIVLITPSQTDDAFLAKIWQVPVLGQFLKALAAFAPKK